MSTSGGRTEDDGILGRTRGVLQALACGDEVGAPSFGGTLSATRATVLHQQAVSLLDRARVGIGAAVTLVVNPEPAHRPIARRIAIDPATGDAHHATQRHVR